MTTLKTRIATAITTSAVLMSSVMPAFAATTSLEISGNGRNSESDVTVSNTNSTTVSQTNTATVNNNTTVSNNTGGNRANDTVGGDVDLRTGNASTRVNVQTSANSNSADVSGCNTCAGNTDVLISGNGRDSSNTVDVANSNSTVLFQNNNASVNNNTSVSNNTGDNRANDTVGGNVNVRSGDILTDVEATTAVNMNVARLGNGSGAGNSGTTARILGNGRDSSSDITLGMSNSTTVLQNNSATVDNNTEVNNNTGDNRANDTVGGDVDLRSGWADTRVVLDTMANFNAASLSDCGCVSGLTAKINGNGRNADGTISAEFANARGVFQTSDADVNNDTLFNTNTGDNHANDSIGKVNAYSDPRVHSGNAWADVEASTATNSNTVGSMTLPTGTNMNFTFDWHSMWGWMSAHM